MFTEMLGLTFTLPAVAGTVQLMRQPLVCGYCTYQRTGVQNWVKRILKGLYGAYGVSSYLSDILSYSRLLALGLATSVIIHGI